MTKPVQATIQNKNSKTVVYSPIDIFLRVIKGKYKAKILIFLNERTLRYSQIRKKFFDCSERILIKQLKELEREKLVQKTVYGIKPPFKSEYKITEYGKTLCPIIKQMWFWAEKHQFGDYYH